jgi:hypothetical protein
MEIELEGIKLVNIIPNPDPTKGPLQLRQVTKITTADKRNLVEHQEQPRPHRARQAGPRKPERFTPKSRIS